jgi:FkbM family methyltransferase
MRHVLGDPVAIESDGFRIEGPFDSRWMLARMKIASWEPFQLELFKGELRSGMTVLDIGANIGFYSLTASRAVGDGGSVYAFEADPRNVFHLKANVISNRCTNITVVEKAVGESAGTQIFRMAEKPTHSSLFTSMRDMPVIATLEVETVAIDDVLAHNPTVDVIKMDIEGGEPAALRGMATTLRASPNLRLFVEYEPLALEAAGESPEEFLHALKSLFGNISVIDESDRRLVPLHHARLWTTQSLYCSGAKSAS